MGARVGEGGLRRRRRRGLVWLLTGFALAAFAVYVTIAATYPAPMGLMLGVLLLYVAAGYLVISGIVDMRAREEEERDPVGADVTPGRRSARCALLGHKEVFEPRTDRAPALFRCRRCGAYGVGHLNARYAWLCDLPVVEHAYDRVGKTADAPEYWRCRRCGVRRYTAPVSAGETLDATRTDLLWIKRYDD